MKAILIVLAAFHYDAGMFGTTVQFPNMAMCEAARVKLVSQDMRPDAWGRPRLIAVCVEN